MFKAVIKSIKLLNHSSRRRYIVLLVARVGAHLLDFMGLLSVGLLGATLLSDSAGTVPPAVFGYTFKLSDQNDLFVWVVIIAAFFILKSLLGAVLLRSTTKFLARVETESAILVSRYIFGGDLHRLYSYSRGDIQWAISASSHTAFFGLLYSAAALVTEGALFVVIFSAFLLVDWFTAVVVGAYFLLLIAVYQLLVSKKLRDLGSKVASSSIEVSNRIVRLIESFREISTNGKTHVFLRQLAGDRRISSDQQALQRFLMGLPRYYVEAALMLGMVALVGASIALGSGSDAFGSLSVFLAGGIRMMAALLPLQNAVADIRIYGEQAFRAHHFIELCKGVDTLLINDPSASDKPATHADRRGVSVALENVSFGYQPGSPQTLRSISLNVESGEFFALVGRSGAGKSTLVDLMLGLQNNFSGNIQIDGLAVQDFRHSYPDDLYYVPQRVGLSPGTIAENVALGKTVQEIDFERVRQSLIAVGLEKLVLNGDILQTDFGAHGESLSGGELQRLGLARALYSGPRLLVVDEPTSGLDSITEKLISSLLEKLAPATTIVVIAHRLSTIKNANRICLLEDGEIQAIDSFSKLEATNPLFSMFVAELNTQEQGGH